MDMIGLMVILLAEMVAPFGIAFVLMGIVYLTSWKRYPKWKARFWWVTFGGAGIVSLTNRTNGLVEFFIFVIVALLIWGVKRGRSSTAKET